MTVRRCYLATAVLIALIVALMASQSYRPAQAEENAPKAVRAVIEAQMAAFQRNDGDAAYAFASPDVRKIFASPENFLRMVRAQYLPVYRPRMVKFREWHLQDGEFSQKLLIVGPRQRAYIAVYTLRRHENDRWLITGVFLAPAPAGDQPL